VLNEFVEIGRQLQPLHIVITNLKEQEFRDNARAARHAQAVSEDRKNKMVAILTRPGNFSSNKGGINSADFDTGCFHEKFVAGGFNKDGADVAKDSSTA
jgi:hypothetical protein